MKRIIYLIALALFFCLNAKSEEVSIREFKLPETQADNLNLYLNLNYSGTDSMNFVNDFSMKYSKFFSSLPFSYSLFAELSNDGDFFTRHFANGTYTVYDRLSFVFMSNMEKYLNNESMLFAGSRFTTNVGSDVNYTENFSSIQAESNVGIGGGYGRTYDASGMAKALRIQEYLLSENLITGEFSKESVLEIAVHCTKIYEYEQKYDDKHPINWYLDLEQILIKSGKLINQNMNPYSLYRIREVLNRERIYQRIIGWKVGAYLAYRNFTLFYDINYEGNNMNYPSDDYLGANLNLEIGYPITNKLHFYHNTNYSYMANTDYTDNNTNNIYSSTSITYNLTNLFDFKINHYLRNYNASHYTVSEQKLSFDTFYYVENNIFLTFSIGLNHFKSDYYNNKNNNFKKEIKLYFGYRFF